MSILTPQKRCHSTSVTGGDTPGLLTELNATVNADKERSKENIPPGTTASNRRKKTPALSSNPYLLRYRQSERSGIANIPADNVQSCPQNPWYIRDVSEQDGPAINNGSESAPQQNATPIDEIPRAPSTVPGKPKFITFNDDIRNTVVPKRPIHEDTVATIPDDKLLVAKARGKSVDEDNHEDRDGDEENQGGGNIIGQSGDENDEDKAGKDSQATPMTIAVKDKSHRTKKSTVKSGKRAYARGSTRVSRTISSRSTPNPRSTTQRAAVAKGDTSQSRNFTSDPVVQEAIIKAYMEDNKQLLREKKELENSVSELAELYTGNTSNPLPDHLKPSVGWPSSSMSTTSVLRLPPASSANQIGPPRGESLANIDISLQSTSGRNTNNVAMANLRKIQVAVNAALERSNQEIEVLRESNRAFAVCENHLIETCSELVEFVEEIADEIQAQRGPLGANTAKQDTGAGARTLSVEPPRIATPAMIEDSLAGNINKQDANRFGNLCNKVQVPHVIHGRDSDGAGSAPRDHGFRLGPLAQGPPQGPFGITNGPSLGSDAHNFPDPNSLHHLAHPNRSWSHVGSAAALDPSSSSTTRLFSTGSFSPRGSLNDFSSAAYPKGDRQYPTSFQMTINKGRQSSTSPYALQQYDPQGFATMYNSPPNILVPAPIDSLINTPCLGHLPLSHVEANVFNPGLDISSCSNTSETCTSTGGADEIFSAGALFEDDSTINIERFTSAHSDSMEGRGPDLTEGIDEADGFKFENYLNFDPVAHPRP